MKKHIFSGWMLAACCVNGFTHVGPSLFEFPHLSCTNIAYENDSERKRHEREESLYENITKTKHKRSLPAGLVSGSSFSVNAMDRNETVGLFFWIQ